MIKFLNTRTDNADVEDIMNHINNYILLEIEDNLEDKINSFNFDIAFENLKDKLTVVNNSYHISIYQPIHTCGKFKGIKSFLKRIIQKSIRWYMDLIMKQQIDYNANVVRVLNEETQIIKALMQENKKLKDKINLQLQVKTKEEINQKQKQNDRDKLYLKLEDTFRGSQEEIKKRNEKYLHFFKKKKLVIDLGCGRGEFLSILYKNDINAIGIDVNNEMIELCQKKGLKVECNDCLNFLKKQPNNSIDGIFSTQLIEHLSYEQLITLITLCYEKLEKNGVFILETVNPLSLGVFCYGFYIDPTHVRPVHPAYLRFLTQSVGFETDEIQFINEFSKEYMLSLSDDMTDSVKTCVNKLNKQIYGAQDYYIVCRKI